LKGVAIMRAKKPRGIPARHTALQYALFCPTTGEMAIRALVYTRAPA
jgi:hypothetical protein